MKKKEANIYQTIKPHQSPYLTKQEINEFKEEFTLFSKEVSIKRISQTTVNRNYTKTDKIVNQFFEELKLSQLSEKKLNSCIGFQQYLLSMLKFFETHNENNSMMMDIMGDNQNEQISKQTIKEALQDSLGRKIYPNQLSIIMEELTKDEFFTQKLKKSNAEEINQM